MGTLHTLTVQAFHMQLYQLLQQLHTVEQAWDDQALQKEFVNTFPEQARILWEVSTDEAKGLCVTLDLAAQHLDMNYLDKEQIAALRYCLGLMRQSVVTEQELDTCHRHLIESGLPPMMGGNDALVELYQVTDAPHAGTCKASDVSVRGTFPRASHLI